MIIFPGCKINIGLHVLGRRPDGYHNIATAMVRVAWSDIVEAVPAQDPLVPRLITSGYHIGCVPENNLAWRAYLAAKEAFGHEAVPCDIYLHKIVPDGAGLGGGSADCTAVLQLLNSVWGADKSVEQIAQLSARLGSDCPFFAYDSAMIATGTGTVLEPVTIAQIKGMHILIVKPAVSVSTACAYAGVTPNDNRPSLRTLLDEPIGSWRECIINDFEASVFARHPLLSGIKSDLYALGAIFASMSGSGAAIYGIFPSEEDALRAQGHFGGHSSWTGALGE